MKLSLKITLVLFAVIALLVLLTSGYFYVQINLNFTAQAERLMAQSEQLIQLRLELLQETLVAQMEQLSSSLFVENETILASLLATPPEFSNEVVSFAERLRRRTTLDFLYVVSLEGIVLSDSQHPAAFGKVDPRTDFPLDEASYVFEDVARLELKRKVSFGHHALFLRGGYFLKNRLIKLPIAGIRWNVLEGRPLPEQEKAASPDTLTRNLVLQDYGKIPVVRIEALVSKEQLDAQRAELIGNSTIFIAISFAVCLLAGYLLSLSLSRPISRLREAAEEMSQGNLDARVEEDAGGEIGALLRAFNQMAGQLQENQRKLLQTERIAAWQEIARHLAHEIKNPLTPIRTSMRNLQLSRDKAPEKFNEIFSEASESILEEVEKLRRLADEFSSFARLPAPNLKTGNLNELIQKSILLYASDSAPQIQFQAGTVPEFPFDQQQISQVLHNLVQNAVDAVQSGGMIRVYTETIQKDERLWACFKIEDTGRGMDEETRKQAFTPYFTTKEKGTGLGLAIVQRIVTEHGGKVFVSSETGKGTTFEIWLPAS